MPLSGKDVCDEVAFRINNRLPANGTGAGSIINYTNDCLGLISSAGSWVFDQTSIVGAVVTTGGVVTPTPNMDVGKKIAIFDNATGAPIVKASQDEYGSASAGYIGASVTTGFNTFRTLVDSAGLTYAGMLQLFPANNGTVDIYYHLTPPVLVYNTTPTVRWTIPEMDDLLKDWTEAKVKQKLGMADANTLWADCLGRMKELRRMYTTERENTGPEDEATGAKQEQLQVGRI